MRDHGFSLLDDLLIRSAVRIMRNAPVRFALDGCPQAAGQPDSRLVIRIRDRATLFRLLLDPDTALGDGFADGRIRVEGDLVATLEAVYSAIRTGPTKGWLASFISHWLDWVHPDSRIGSRRNIHHHYDLGTDFYRLWLDRDLVYTCAYFPEEVATIEDAQAAKLEYVCRKLNLRAGESVVEAGCGWGALALHMARHYNVSVKAFNLSHEQIREARSRAAREGLANQVEFIEDDYRNVSGRFDVFVSIGMLEHVGRSHYPDLANVIHRSIGDGGRGLLHFIGRSRPYPLSNWIRKRIFPGAYVPTLREAAAILERFDYSVLDVENLRWHYAKTLEHWLDRFERNCGAACAGLDERFLRAWRLYLAGSLVAFRVGTLQLFQVLFAGRDCGRIPATRGHLYARAGSDLCSHSTS